MNLVRQPTASNLCGQACVATLCAITLDEAIAIVGTKGKTRPKQIVAALKAKGLHPFVGMTLMSKRGFIHPEETHLCKFKGDRGSHWVIRHNGKWYDPAAGVFREVPRYLATAKLTSYLVVCREPKFGMEGYST